MELKQINLKDRIINLFGDIDEATCKDAIERILDLNIKDSEYIENALSIMHSMGFKVDPGYISLPPITLNLSTYGGEVYSGFGLCDCIKMSETYVKCICYGKVMSMGVPILLSAKYKAAHKNTIFMIHDMTSYSYDKLKNCEENVEHLVSMRNRMVDFICSNSKFPRKKMIEIIEKKQDFYFTAEEALKWKIIDEIIDDVDVVDEKSDKDTKTTKK